MTIERSKTLFYVAAVALGLVAVFGLVLMSSRHVEAQFAPNSDVRIATSSTIGVGPQEVKTISPTSATSSITGLCSDRVISTVASPIMLSFSSDIVPTALIGHVQAASTTVTYQSSQFGCGPIRAYGFASTTITQSTFFW